MSNETKQVEKDHQWLIKRMDILHRVLCPNLTGTWQQRTRQVVQAVRKAKRTR